MTSIDIPSVNFDNSPQEPHILENKSTDDFQKTLENFLQSNNGEWLFWSTPEAVNNLYLTLKLDKEVITFTSSSNGADSDYYHFATSAHIKISKRKELFGIFKKASNGLPMGIQYISTYNGKNRSAWNFIVGSSKLNAEL